jgi:hypothetical protein
MPIRFTFDGENYECDTPKEAATLRKLLGRPRRQKRQGRVLQVAGPRPIQQALSPGSVVGSSHTSNVFRALLDAPGGLSSDALAHTLGVGPKSLPPIMGHVNALLISHNYEVKHVLERRTIYDKGRAKSVYVLTNLGREIVPKLLAA